MGRMKLSEKHRLAKRIVNLNKSLRLAQTTRSALLPNATQQRSDPEAHMAGNDRKSAYPSPYPQGAVTHPDGGSWEGGHMKHPGQDSKYGGSLSKQATTPSTGTEKPATSGGKNRY
jgi:hypothetical protein